MENLSKEELLALLTTKEKKTPRKKQELSEEKRAELLDRLAGMRETVKKNREAKKAPEVEKDLDAIFEKKYNSKFEKIESVLGEVADTQKEIIKMKREKAEAKKQAEKPKEVEKPKEAEKPKEVPKPVEVPFVAPVLPIRNPNIFTKGRTRF